MSRVRHSLGEDNGLRQVGGRYSGAWFRGVYNLLQTLGIHPCLFGMLLHLIVHCSKFSA